MGEIGKKIRMERIIDRKSRKTVIIPMDHGITVGPIRGIENVPEMVNKVADGGANAVLMHKGIVTSGHRGYGKDIGLVMHLSASTTLGPDPNNKVLVTSVEEAIKLGADAVSVHVNIGSETESDQLQILGSVSEDCMNWGMPLLAMMYPRGKDIKDPNQVEVVKIAARVGAELGADMIKTNYTGSTDTFREVVRGCPVPVVIAGGPKTETDLEFLKMVEDSMKAGAAGVASGRNVFQHKDPSSIVRAIAAVVHEGKSAKEAIKLVKE